MLTVLGTGFGRTGTHSLARTLELLGFGLSCTVYAITERAHAAFWKEALNGQPVDWDALYEGCKSAVEWPKVVFLPWVLKQYPEAKVCLTVRDPEAWWKSTNATIGEGLELSQFNPDPAARGATGFLRPLILENVIQNRHCEKISPMQSIWPKSREYKNSSQTTIC